MPGPWRNETRPGYFGRRRDEIVAGLTARWGQGNWRLVWVADGLELEFADACKQFYEEAYFLWLQAHPEAVRFITSYSEVYDNAISNIASGLDYTKQESYSTHIQDIAIRNSLRRLGVWFRREHKAPLQIRGTGEGAQYNPGHIPYHRPEVITKPSLRPQWSGEDMVEDFWQSNKYIQVRDP